MELDQITPNHNYVKLGYILKPREFRSEYLGISWTEVSWKMLELFSPIQKYSDMLDDILYVLSRVNSKPGTDKENAYLGLLKEGSKYFIGELVELEQVPQYTDDGKLLVKMIGGYVYPDTRGKQLDEL